MWMTRACCSTALQRTRPAGNGSVRFLSCSGPSLRFRASTIFSSAACVPPHMRVCTRKADGTQLRAMYLQGSSGLWHASWNLLGAGLRLAQDVGAHRRKVYSEKPTIHDELWRRAFWYRFYRASMHARPNLIDTQGACEFRSAYLVCCWSAVHNPGRRVSTYRWNSRC
jgi:hypothetical protein